MHTGTERSRHDGRREQEEHIPKRTIFALFAWFMIAPCSYYWIQTYLRYKSSLSISICAKIE
jgi:hypothetical protein